MLVIIFMHLFKLSWLFMMDDNYRQQTPLSLTFARPWAMPNLAKFRIFAIPQKYTCVQTRIVLWIKIHRSNFQTYPYYLQPWGFLAFTWILSNWKTEWSSQALYLRFFCSTIILEFYKFSKIKTQRFLCMTLSSLSYMWYLWILTKAIIIMLCLFLLL